MPIIDPRVARLYECAHERYDYILRVSDGSVKYYNDINTAQQWCKVNGVTLLVQSKKSSKNRCTVGDSGYLYIFQGGGLVKVGYTYKNPLDRLKACQVGSPVELSLAYAVRFGNVVNLEREIHDKLYQLGLWVRGEWFDCDPAEVIELINLMRNEGVCE